MDVCMLSRESHDDGGRYRITVTEVRGRKKEENIK
jgi:hypothetical protein